MLFCLVIWASFVSRVLVKHAMSWPQRDEVRSRGPHQRRLWYVTGVRATDSKTEVEPAVSARGFSCRSDVGSAWLTTKWPHSSRSNVQGGSSLSLSTCSAMSGWSLVSEFTALQIWGADPPLRTQKKDGRYTGGVLIVLLLLVPLADERSSASGPGPDLSAASAIECPAGSWCFQRG